MRYLIDTQIFLWFIAGSDNLTPAVKTLIENEHNEICISIASLWEISIKTSLGKLKIAGSYETVIEDVTSNNMEIIPINFAHTVEQYRLPFYHRDPFDRIIVAQSITEKIDLISSDTIFDMYLADKKISRIG